MRTQHAKNWLAPGVFLTTVLALAIVWPQAARGQQNIRRVPTLNFEPTVSTEGLLTVEPSKTLGHLRWSAGLYLGYANDPLQTSINDRILYRAVAHQLTMDVVAALGITKYIELGLHFPVVWYQDSDGTPQMFSGSSVEDLKTLAIGDLRIVPKVRFWTRETSHFGMGLVLQMTTPTGFRDANTGEPKFTFEPKLVLDYRWDSGVVAAVNLGYRLRLESVESANLMVDDEFMWGVGVEVPLGSRRVSLVAELNGAVGFKDAAADMDEGIDLEEVPVEFLGAVRYRSKMGLVFTLGAGVGATNGYGTPDFRVFTGLGYAPPVKEKGIKTPPKGPKDTDGDGLLDPVDKCPKDPEDKDGFEDEDGCPEPDNDKDGICDPNPTIQKNLDKYTSVCKGKDKCPLIPEDKDGFQDEDGCPDADNDKDGICDNNDTIQKNLAKYSAVCRGFDKCPMKKETINGIDDEDGCPDKGKVLVKITDKKLEIFQKVYFAYNKATIRPRSYRLLNVVASVLRHHPYLKKVRIEGHTDRRGGYKFNINLSQRRADAVRRFLVNRGKIDTSRFVTKGFGYTQPRQEQCRRVKNWKARRDCFAANRRVEFIIVERGK